MQVYPALTPLFPKSRYENVVDKGRTVEHRFKVGPTISLLQPHVTSSQTICLTPLQETWTSGHVWKEQINDFASWSPTLL
jgi:hypothetical protein